MCCRKVLIIDFVVDFNSILRGGDEEKGSNKEKVLISQILSLIKFLIINIVANGKSSIYLIETRNP